MHELLAKLALLISAHLCRVAARYCSCYCKTWLAERLPGGRKGIKGVY